MLPSDTPRLPVWPFLLGDAVLLATAGLIAYSHPGPLAGGPLLAVVLCVLFGVAAAVTPYLANHGKQQEAALDERQRALDALTQKLSNSADQMSVAANGLNELVELTQKSLRQAEHLPQKLQEKIAEFNQQLSNAQADEREELERELTTLRTAEGDRLEATADKVQKALLELGKLEAATHKHLLATTEALSRVEKSGEAGASRIQEATSTAAAAAAAMAATAIEQWSIAALAAKKSLEDAVGAALVRVADQAEQKASSANAAFEARSAAVLVELDKRIASLEALLLKPIPVPAGAAAVPVSATSAAPASASEPVLSAFSNPNPEVVAVSEVPHSGEIAASPDAATATDSSLAIKPAVGEPPQPRRGRRSKKELQSVDNAAAMPAETSVPAEPLSQEATVAQTEIQSAILEAPETDQPAVPVVQEAPPPAVAVVEPPEAPALAEVVPPEGSAVSAVEVAPGTAPVGEVPLPEPVPAPVSPAEAALAVMDAGLLQAVPTPMPEQESISIVPPESAPPHDPAAAAVAPEEAPASPPMDKDPELNSKQEAEESASARQARRRQPKPAEDDRQPSLGLVIEEPARDDFTQDSPEESRLLTSVSADGATRLLVTAYIGIGNRLYVRGEGPGLSLERGLPLQFVSIGKWRWETAEATAPVRIKLLKNDQQECPMLGEIMLDPGHQAEVTANF